MEDLQVSRECLLELGPGIKQWVERRRSGGEDLCDDSQEMESGEGDRSKCSAAELGMGLEHCMWRRGGILKELQLACLPGSLARGSCWEFEWLPGVFGTNSYLHSLNPWIRLPSHVLLKYFFLEVFLLFLLIRTVPHVPFLTRPWGEG